MPLRRRALSPCPQRMLTCALTIATLSVTMLGHDSIAYAGSGELVTTFGGDVCLDRSRLVPEAKGTRLGSKLMPWKKLTRHIRKWVNGDINFVNLETVVSDKPLSSVQNQDAFLSHPIGVDYLVRRGINLMSTANNHAYDYGQHGARSTLRHLPRLMRKRKKLHQADYKILSAHVGVERSVRLDRGQRAKYEQALKRAGVDLIIGHHPHVVRPVQREGRKLVFYSLGNYLIRGARNMAPFPDRLDYGLFGRVYLTFDVKRGRLVPTAVEAIPMTEMHAVSRPLASAEGKRRVAVLNKISKKQLGAEGLQFKVRKDGSGVACLGGSYGPRARKICRRKRR